MHGHHEMANSDKKNMFALILNLLGDSVPKTLLNKRLNGSGGLKRGAKDGQLRGAAS